MFVDEGDVRRQEKNENEETSIRDIRENIGLRWNRDINAKIDYMC